MKVKKYHNLNSVERREVSNLHKDVFSKGYADLSLMTNIFFEDSRFIGYVEAGYNPRSYAENVFKSSLGWLNPKDRDVCEGLYIKYIAVNPLLRGKGYGSEILSEAINIERNDIKDRCLSLTNVVSAIVEGTNNSGEFFIKEGFERHKEFQNGYLDEYMKKIDTLYVKRV